MHGLLTQAPVYGEVNTNTRPKHCVLRASWVILSTSWVILSTLERLVLSWKVVPIKVYLFFALVTGGGWRQPKRVFLENGAFWGSDCVFLEKYACAVVVTPLIREIRIPMSQSAPFSRNTQSAEADWLWLEYNSWRQVVTPFTAATVKIRRSLQTCSTHTHRIFHLRHLSTQTRFGLQRQFESRFAVHFFEYYLSKTPLCALERNKTLQKSTNFDFAQTSSRVSFEREAIWAKLTGAKMRGIQEIRNLADVSKKSSNV